ncbi:DUF1150 family protein [Kozakia baliensis]|uniref:Uncharacterized protein n=1 Tax=Kozakia baliensis TaxID=153496 RepID=A0A1D8US57_9PROT|nr:DUF1150 family protein [Kozakia baliensis]AOX16337.1 hypothetical protein A0U89_03470 [Kozakia baliensis]AOX19298.1 hypothetical protein A0U90_02190 [Kozakia baliensis]GBR28661.1 hypothetical protein AA0488_1498 [Kozakia baliensis NRIC 0488]GEL63601.1 hypothetical protein KBA01_08870 [Kozakia baliensis]
MTNPFHEDGVEMPQERIPADLRRMTNKELRNLGMSKLAYVRPVIYEGEAAFAIHAADGTPMALTEDRDSAVEAIIDHEMIPAWVH